MGVYSFEYIGQGRYRLFESEVLLLTFTRESIRTALESVDRSSHWVGCMIRMFNKKFSLSEYSVKLDPEAPCDYPLDVLIRYLQSKGFRVYRPMGLKDEVVIAFLVSKGYAVESDFLFGGPFRQKETLPDKVFIKR